MTAIQGDVLSSAKYIGCVSHKQVECHLMKGEITCIDAKHTKAWSRSRAGEGIGRKKKKAREIRSYVTMPQFRQITDGKLKRSLEIKAETSYPYQVKFK